MNRFKTSPYKPTTVEIENINERRAKIIAYPFESGYGVTLAHPIRRLLLSSSVGFAPIAIKIEGASHEFDSVRGMSEDVSIFIINLKNIRFKLKEGVDRAVVEYSFSGSKEILGKDLNSDEVEVVTKDEYLATINEDAKLKFSIIVQRGLGYVPSESVRDIIKDEINSTEYITLDAFFTPVKNVVYDIENVLIEDNPNFEKVVFTVTTDGQIDPVTAFKNALSAMYDQMEVFKNELDITSLSTGVQTQEDIPELKSLTQKVEELNLSARSFNCLDRSSIKYVGELALMSENELKEVKNLGKKSLDEIKSKLEEIGFPVGSELEEDLVIALKKKLEKLKSI
jgi:DNA-directed RNA polymerase subunit alpha